MTCASNRSFLDMAADALRAKSVANDVSQLACCPIDLPAICLPLVSCAACWRLSHAVINGGVCS